jgi:hypothetical protein
MLFGTLICSDLQLICNPQITANQTPSALKKHVKTRANQCKSLQITGLEKHRKNNADLQPGGGVDPHPQVPPPPNYPPLYI